MIIIYHKHLKNGFSNNLFIAYATLNYYLYITVKLKNNVINI